MSALSDKQLFELDDFNASTRGKKLFAKMLIGVKKQTIFCPFKELVNLIPKENDKAGHKSFHARFRLPHY
jgi:hypothetical protein